MYRIVFSVGVVLTILFSILLTDSPPYIFLSIVLLVQVLASAISLGMDTLKGESGTTSSNSLLTKQDEINE